MPVLFEIIDGSFADVPYPGDDHLTFTDEADREFGETWNVLRGKDWRQMPVEEFIQGDTPVPSLTPKALHYYLPALLKASLTGDSGGGVISDLVCFLNPAQTRRCSSWENGGKQEYEEFCSLPTEPRHQAIAAEWLFSQRAVLRSRQNCRKRYCFLKNFQSFLGRSSAEGYRPRNQLGKPNP